MLDQDVRFHIWYRFDMSVFDPKIHPEKTIAENIVKWRAYLEMVRSFAKEERRFVPSLDPEELVRQAGEGRDPKYLVFVCFRSEPIGYLSFAAAVDAKGNATVLLKQAWIKPEYRERGIFKRLITLLPDLMSPSLYAPRRVVRMIAAFPSSAVNETAGKILTRLGFRRTLTDYRKDFPKKQGIRFATVCMDNDPPVLRPFDVVALDHGNKCGDAFRRMIDEFYAERKAGKPALSLSEVRHEFMDGLCFVSLIFDERRLIGYVLWQGPFVLQAWLKREYRGRGIYKRFIDLLPDLCFLETGEAVERLIFPE